MSRDSVVAILGQHAALLERARSLAEEAGFGALATSDETELFTWLDRASLRLIIVGGGVDGRVRDAVHARVADRRPDVRVVDVFGGPPAMTQVLRELAATEAT